MKCPLLRKEVGQLVHRELRFLFSRKLLPKFWNSSPYRVEIERERERERETDCINLRIQ